jgi:hypothetical protein
MDTLEIGKTYNRLTITEVLPKKGGQNIRVITICSCGVTKEIRLSHIKSGKIKSCGCLNLEMKFARGKHHLTEHLLYGVWCNMRSRCYNEKNVAYRNYGGRGIRVHHSWNNFIVFYNWAISAGWEKGLEIDRINNNGNYTPKNCRIVTPRNNNRNRRTSIYFTYNGKKLFITDLCEEFGIDRGALLYRIRELGWSIDKAIKTPVRKPHKIINTKTGVVFASLQEAADCIGMPYGTLEYQLKHAVSNYTDLAFVNG